MPNKSMSGNELPSSKDARSNPYLKVLGLTKVRLSIACYSPGISCSSFGSHPLITPRNSLESEASNFTKCFFWTWSHGLLSSLCVVWLATQKEGNAHRQHLLINHPLMEMLLSAKPRTIIMLTTSISCYWELFRVAELLYSYVLFYSF